MGLPRFRKFGVWVCIRFELKHSFMTQKTDKVKYTKSLVTKSSTPRTAPVQHIQKYEKVAIRKYEEISGQTVYNTGICVSLNSPYLAASPDGIVDEDTIDKAGLQASLYFLYFL